MPVVFDEVVGTVEAPSPAAAEKQHAPAAEKADDRDFRSALARREQRAARLRAD